MKCVGFLICGLLTATVEGGERSNAEIELTSFPASRSPPCVSSQGESRSSPWDSTEVSSQGESSRQRSSQLTVARKICRWARAKITAPFASWCYHKCRAFRIYFVGGSPHHNIDPEDPPEDAISYWTVSKAYFFHSKHKLENSLLRKNVLGPVAVLINKGLRVVGLRAHISIGSDPLYVFSNAFLTVSKLLAEDIEKTQDSKSIAKFLGDGCSGFTLTDAELEEQRKKYADQLKLQKRKAPFEAAPRAIVALSGWTRREALRVGTLQVKCLALRLSDQKVKEPDSMSKIDEVKREIAGYPEFLKTVLKAKIGLMEPLCQMMEEVLVKKEFGDWTFKCPKIWKYESLDQLLDEVSSEVQQE